ncbi:MAG TPA: gliding motility-associated C-terminal domain-containing protein, partial [Bacteroidia bacterium]|nr:gliding motility-associated C-terminal domain-containing protein [Bacteroidia bacterium]
PYTCTVTDVNGCTTVQSVTITQPAALTVSLSSQINVTCNGGNNGEATVTAGGGSPGYSYAWSPSGGNASTAPNLISGNYTCTVTDNNTCTVTQTVNITQPPAITSTVTSVNSTCGNSNGTATVAASGGAGSFSYLWTTTGDTMATDTALAAGTYSVDITDANGCTSGGTVTVSNTPGPAVSLASQVDVTCNGGNNGTATVNPSGGTLPYSYSWSPSGGNAITGTSLAAGTYTCTITDANNCAVTQTATITEPLAVTATTSTVNATCGNSNGSATVNASGGSGGYTYSWAPSGGNAATESNIPAGTYTCTITDVNGCTGTSIVSVNNIGGPVVSLASQIDVTCNGGNNGTAMVNASGGNPGYTYAWNPSGGNAATGTSLSAGTYTCTVTDASGCIQTQTVQITEPPVITTSSVFTPETCGNGNGTATVTAGGGAGSFTYSWSPSGGNAATASGLSAGNYSCTVTDANGCTATETVNIVNSAAPVVTLASQTDVSCAGGTNGQAMMNVSGGAPGYTYVWSPSGGNTATGTSLTAGTYTCDVTDANGCASSQTVTITEPAPITATMSVVNAACSQSNGSATIAVSGGTGSYSYSWSPSGGNASTANALSAGTYVCIVTDANGCSHLDTAIVNTTNGPSVTVTSQTDPTCNGLTDGSVTVNVTGGTPGYTYSWSPSGGTTATGSGLGQGSYTCTITDAAGCVQTQTATLTEPALLTATSSFTNVLCNGGTTGTASVIAGGGTPNYSYNWSPTGGTSSNATGLAQGSYTCTITDANGCTATQSVTITQPSAITVSATPSAGCGVNGGSAVATAGGGTPGYSYAWTPSGGTSASATGLAAGSYTCTVTDANGCSANTPVTVTTNPLPTPTVSSGTTIIIGSSTTLTATGGTSYVWTPSTDLSCVSCQSPVASPTQTTTYCVNVTDANGCSDSACTTVAVNTDCGTIFVPSGFSPNGDNENDQLCIYGTQCMQSVDFVIYDRWGEKVFETTDPHLCWDGTYKGEMLNNGVFVYYLQAYMLDGSIKTQKGNITLVR